MYDEIQPALWADEWSIAVFPSPGCPSAGHLQAEHKLFAAALVGGETSTEQSGLRVLRFHALHSGCSLSLSNYPRWYLPEEHTPQTAVTPSPTHHPSRCPDFWPERFWGTAHDCPGENPPREISSASLQPQHWLRWVPLSLGYDRTSWWLEFSEIWKLLLFILPSFTFPASPDLVPIAVTCRY